MEYLSVSEIAQLWGVSERSVRNYCAQGRVKDAVLTGKTWYIPVSAQKPARLNASSKATANALLTRLLEEKNGKISGGIYHRLQIELTYNSNHIEGSHLSKDQTRLIFETATIDAGKDALRVDDILETSNHFCCIDYCLENVNKPLSEKLIKELHAILKGGTADSRLPWFAVGNYKQMPNEVGGHKTTAPEDVVPAMAALLESYDSKRKHTLADIIDFHVKLERIHPFQDGNGRVGRLIMLKECLANGIVPFVITDNMKLFYYRGLSQWDNEPGYLTDTCLAAQDTFKEWLEYFRIPYKES